MIRNILVVFLLLFVGFSCDLKNRKTKNLRDIYGQNLILPDHAIWKIEGRDTVINIENLAPKLVNQHLVKQEELSDSEKAERAQLRIELKTANKLLEEDISDEFNRIEEKKDSNG